MCVGVQVSVTRCAVSQFFERAAQNVKDNMGDDIQTDQLMREACRNALEHVRSLPVSDHTQ